MQLSTVRAARRPPRPRWCSGSGNDGSHLDRRVGRGDVLERARRSGHVPKIIFTETSSEYWARAGSLLHTDVEGKKDIAPAPNVRLYFFTGAQHGVSSSSNRGIYKNLGNTLNYRPLLRALLVRLDHWVTTGKAPPPSRYPRIADGTLVNLETYRRSFPKIPGVTPAEVLYTPVRLDLGPRWRSHGIADFVPPKIGPPFKTLVPAIDADGNEIAGVRLPDVAVPLAAYSGWNQRSAKPGAGNMLGRWSGSTWPFPATQEERRKTGDPRPSIRERYLTHEVYRAKVAEAALALEKEGFLLSEDVLYILNKAAERMR